jgi:chromosomal replication initiation ATPase DnaA
VEEELIGEIEDPFAAVRWQQVLGGEGFLRKLKDHWNQRAERPKNYGQKIGQKRNWSAIGAQQILELVSEHFQSDLETLKQGGTRKNLARQCAMTLCWDHADLSHDEIAALFRMPGSNSVAQTIRRTKAHDAQTLKVLKGQISHK